MRERCKGVHCVDLGESFPTSIYLQKSASIQPRTSPSKFGGKLCNIIQSCPKSAASPLAIDSLESGFFLTCRLFKAGTRGLFKPGAGKGHGGHEEKKACYDEKLTGHTKTESLRTEEKAQVEKNELIRSERALGPP